MRIYANFKEAVSEVKRDLKEMGIKVHPQTMQNKYVADDPDYETLELQNYIYTVLDIDTDSLEISEPWVQKEFAERIDPYFTNPGYAWIERSEIWQEMLGPDKRFDYTYSERMQHQIKYIIQELRSHPDSRQLYLSIWNPDIDIYKLGGQRVPCSLGYLFQYREGKLNVTYMMRSCDIMTHYQNDLYLCVRLLKHIAFNADMEPGTVTHSVGSLHAYKKDLKEVF